MKGNKNMKKLKALVIIIAILIVSCKSNSIVDKDILFQVSLLQGLTFGDYNGSITAKELKSKGDIGIGTFDKLDGELIMLDGVIYKAKHDGTVEIVNDAETIPFSNVTFFESDVKHTVNNINDINELKDYLNAIVNNNNANIFYVVRIDGTFNEMNVRSEYSQELPYMPLAKVLETDQTFYDYKDIDGTVVGIYCPQYMNMLNATGWHFHFISKDRKKGGHILDLNVKSADIMIDYTEKFNMILPNNDMFKNFDLSIDQSKDIKKVETNN